MNDELESFWSVVFTLALGGGILGWLLTGHIAVGLAVMVCSILALTAIIVAGILAGGLLLAPVYLYKLLKHLFKQ